MSNPKFRPTVFKALTPVLSKHGFVPRPDLNRVGVSEFTRELRGYENCVSFQLSQHVTVQSSGTRAFQFFASAPKFGSAPSYYFRSYKEYWWYYNTQEELDAALGEATALLVDKVLPWLDTYTPGNVPDWSALVPEILSPVLESHGFQYLQGRHPMGHVIPDMAWFMHESCLCVCADMRVPGEIVPRVTNTMMRRIESAKTLDGPTSRYASEESFTDALRDVAAFLAKELEGWVRVYSNSEASQ